MPRACVVSSSSSPLFFFMSFNCFIHSFAFTCRFQIRVINNLMTKGTGRGNFLLRNLNLLIVLRRRLLLLLTSLLPPPIYHHKLFITNLKTLKASKSSLRNFHPLIPFMSFLTLVLRNILWLTYPRMCSFLEISIPEKYTDTTIIYTKSHEDCLLSIPYQV